MTAGGIPEGLRPLLRLDAARVAAGIRRPRLGTWIGIGAPAVLLLILLAIIGRVASSALPRPGAEGGVAVGLLTAGPVSFLAYSTLFRGGDESFLRSAGVQPAGLYYERVLRFLGVSLLVAALAAIPLALAGGLGSRLVASSIAAAVIAWGGSVLTVVMAAAATVGRPPGTPGGCLSIGLGSRDPEMAAVAPLIYAPIPPLLAGAVAGGLAGEPRVELLPVLGGIGFVAGLGIAAAGRAWVRALGRIQPLASEMAFEPVRSHPATARPRQGLARILPGRVAAARARDTAVIGRRSAWALRVVWPVAVLAPVALARFGTHASATFWVAGAVLLVWGLQAAAAVSLGFAERSGPRWIDRAAGLTGTVRFLGRWAWGVGASLWLAVPVALAWEWWAAGGPGWFWLVPAIVISAAGAAASTLAAGVR